MPSSATTTDAFDATPSPEPATADSYGLPPRGYRLPDATRLGAAHLQVADLDRSVAFYAGTMGFHVATRAGAHAVLTAKGNDRVLIELREHRGARPAARRASLGLFHVAILLPDRPALGRFLGHMRSLGVPVGAGDHRVSEALYLSDPDGLGLEVYADRPRASWQRLGRELMLATDPVDLDALLDSGADGPWTGMPTGTTIGHVHLQVGDLAIAQAFFGETLGFDRMTTRYPGALFLGAGGYHHHVGTNTWAGPSARPPGAEDARLLAWTIELPDVPSLHAAAASLRAAGRDADFEGETLLRTRDPWGTAIRLTAPGAP